MLQVGQIVSSGAMNCTGSAKTLSRKEALRSARLISGDLIFSRIALIIPIEDLTARLFARI